MGNFKILKGIAWGIITARGGSKSIPLKNIFPVYGKPLIEYVINAAKHAKSLNRILCSTDHPDISEVCTELDIEVIERPEYLSGDFVRSDDVMIDAAKRCVTKDGGLAEILVLLQPTSIFMKASHIDEAVYALVNNPHANSSQTIVTVPHQFHAVNQRKLYDDDSDIGWVFPEEREISFNKQTKPVYYAIGNVIAMRIKALFEYNSMYSRPSIPIEIPLPYSYDLDTEEDIELAELMLANKFVDLD